MTYDDERVVALLKESVPSVPDVPGRVDAVRRLAGRQRTFAQAQVLGAAASVVLVVAAVTALLRPGGTQELRPVADPARVMVAALERERSLLFEQTTRVEQDGKPPEVTTVRGGALTDGSVYVSETVGGPDGMRIRVVGGYAYRAPRLGEAPPGTRWVREPASEWRRTTEQLVEGAGDLGVVYRFVRTTTIDGVEVAEYETTTTIKGATPVHLTVALDAKGRPRRYVVVSEVDGTRVTMSMTFFGYGEPVTVEPPPASEVIDVADVPRRP